MITDKMFLSQAEFCALSADKREKLREVFAISRSGQVKVQSGLNGDKLVSDGTEPHDLMTSLNLPAVLKFLGQEYDEALTYDFDALFKHVLARLYPGEAKEISQLNEVAKGEEREPIPQPTAEVKEEEKKTIVVVQKKPVKKGRPKLNA